MQGKKQGTMANKTVHKTSRIIILYGCPVSGKTTAANKVKDFLAKRGIPAEVISSAKLRLGGKKHGSTKGFVDEEKPATRKVKDRAYKLLCRRAEVCLEKGAVPILDATFHKYGRRKNVYQLARKKGTEVCVLWIVFNNEKAIRKILDKRRKAKKLNMLHTWEQYATMVRQTERLENFELSTKQRLASKVLKVIKFDRERNKVLLHNCAKDMFAKEVAEAVSNG